MSKAAETPSKPASTPGESADQHALAQVERWMALIREISHERQVPIKLRG